MLRAAGRWGERVAWFLNSGLGFKPAYVAQLSLSRTLKTTFNFCASFHLGRGVLFIKQSHQHHQFVNML